MVQTQVTAQGWLGSTPEGRHPQIPGPFHFPIEDDAISTDFSQWNMAHSLPPASLAIDHSSLATCHSPLFQAVSARSIWGEPGRTANRQAFPSSPYPAISHSLQDRQIERISFRVSTNTHRAPLRGLSEARAFTSYRIGKDHPHDPDILSLRHDCPTLAAVSGKWFPLDGRSAIATGWFPSLSDRVRGPSHPPGGCSVTRPPTCRVTRPSAWSQASILNRFASSLAGG